MKNLKLVFASVILLTMMTANGFSQSVDELIENYGNAMGGQEKLLALNTVKYTGKYSGNGLDVPMTMSLKKGGKARLEMSYQGQSLIRASDGTTGWFVNPFQGNKEAVKMPAEELKEMRKNAEIEGELINYKEKGYKVESLGKDDFEGSEVYKIKLTDKDGDVTFYFLDASTYFILKQSTKRKIKEKEIKSEIIYGNYQVVDGVMFPMSIEFRKVGSDQGQKVVVEKVETNVSVDDSIFIMPAAK